VRRRLENDVGPYFATIRAVHDHTGQGVGFWALTRMLLPVVEAVAAALYRSRTQERPPVRLLRTLGFEFPNLVWEMYRHTLMHNDEMVTASYMGRRVTWEIGVGTGHGSDQGHLRVDALRLYDELVSFLTRQASDARRSGAHVWVRDSFRFNTWFGRATRDEILRLGKK
jgi:hypothetical protein